MKNVTIDTQLCVGNETVLRTCTDDGGALVVQNGCCTQTSGNLVHICGESGQNALKVESGKVIIDPNEDLAQSNSIGLHVYNSAAQSDNVNGELMRITGNANETTLSVQNGETHLVSASDIGNALFISNSVEQTSNELVLIDGTSGQSGDSVLLKIQGVEDQNALVVDTGKMVLDPNSTNGGALVISNSQSQGGGELMSITGSAGEVALKVTEGKTHLDPNSSQGEALVISNSDNQQGGSILTHIQGESGQIALQVDDGRVVLDNLESSNAVLTGGSIDNVTIGSSNALAGTFTSVSIDPDNVSGNALIITNSSELQGNALVSIDGATNGQTNGRLVDIVGTANQEAVYVSNGLTTLEGNTSADNRALSANTFVDATAQVKIRGGVAIEGVDYSNGENTATLTYATSTVQGGTIVSGGVAVGGALWSTTDKATDDATSAHAGLLVGGGAIVQKNLIITSSVLGEPDQTVAGSYGEIQIHNSKLYIHNGSEWRKQVMPAAHQPVPTNTNDPGELGEIRTDDDYIYVCTSTGWKKTVLGPL